MGLFGRPVALIPHEVCSRRLILVDAAEATTLGAYSVTLAGVYQLMLLRVFQTPQFFRTR